MDLNVSLMFCLFLTWIEVVLKMVWFAFLDIAVRGEYYIIPCSRHNGHIEWRGPIQERDNDQYTRVHKRRSYGGTLRMNVAGDNSLHIQKIRVSDAGIYACSTYERHLLTVIGNVLVVGCSLSARVSYFQQANAVSYIRDILWNIPFYFCFSIRDIFFVLLNDMTLEVNHLSVYLYSYYSIHVMESLYMIRCSHYVKISPSGECRIIKQIQKSSRQNTRIYFQRNQWRQKYTILGQRDKGRPCHLF